MKTKTVKQINLKIPENLYKVAKRYVEEYGFRNIQDLAMESVREKIFERSEFDETFSRREIELIDAIIKASLRRKKVVSEAELLKVLKS